MRLIDSETFSVREFVQNPPPYAILSHTWGVDEVTLQSFGNGTASRRAGFAKIQICAQLARQDGLQYFWADTCCIDKTSSAELTEAINSTFRWFHDATVCYVHLSDVSDDTWTADFQRSRWFTRGWTLQELLAPRLVKFFSDSGRLLGDKVSLEGQIHQITSIPVRALRGDPLETFSVAERMSWAADRLTTRPEDKAYSLFGIFGVSLPIIYGEGTRAFQRLNDEISRTVTTVQRSETLTSAPRPRTATTAQRSGTLTTLQRSDVTGMRLLVAGSDPVRIETVPFSDDLQYAILSHTWAIDEVLFEDMRLGTAERRRGYAKIRKCCDLAVKHGFEYVWVDTCCIDKSSSAELQEAICSMYKWYKNARICYVYLADCQYNISTSFEESRWFKRGWTLQELIAPEFVEFYDQNWIEIGTKQSLCDRIAKITTIDPLVLRGADPTKRTVAERMSWAAWRSTTRDEDEAYSLMGLFNVFMPMLYGEGRRAFIRLQEEIIKQTEDYTIFSWKAKDPDIIRGIFAHSPAEFSAIKLEKIDTRGWYASQEPGRHPPPVVSGRGLALTLPLLRCNEADKVYLGWVSCSYPEGDRKFEDATLRCILLRETQSIPQIFARICPETLEYRPMREAQHFMQQAIYVLPATIDSPMRLDRERTGRIIVHSLGGAYPTLSPQPVAIAEDARWSAAEQSITYPYRRGLLLLAKFAFGPENDFAVIIGVQDDAPWCCIMTQEDAVQEQMRLEDVKLPEHAESILGGRSDRAQRVSQSFTATATLRVAPSASRHSPCFGLHVRSIQHDLR